MLRKRIIYELVDKGVAAFGIKPGQYLHKVPEDMIEHADLVGLPLLEIPPDVPYMDIMLPIFELLINEQLYQLRRTEEIHDLLIKVILGGTGLQGICKALAQFTGNPVFIFGHGACLGAGYPPISKGQIMPVVQETLEIIFQEAPQELKELAPHRAAHLKLNPNMPFCVIVPVAARKTIDGYLVIIESCRPLDDVEIRGIETGATIVALEFAREKAIAETELRLRGELLDELLQGKIENVEAIMKRASHLGINLAGRLAVLIVGFNLFSQIMDCPEDDVSTEIIHLMRSRFSRHPGGLLLASKGNLVIGLLRFYSETEKELPERLQEILATIKARFPKLRVRVGVGRIYEGLHQIKTSYEEARLALKVAWEIDNASKPVFFAELGPMRILFNVKDAPSVNDFCNEYIGKIQAYDAQNKTDLITTLACYLKNDGNLRKTATDLFVHKNSVIYRVKKIEEITGLNLTKVEDRFTLMLALKLAQLNY